MSGSPAPASPARGGLERWIYALDELIRIPGTRLSFGIDVLLGLLPVVGDFAGLLCGVPVLVAAVRRRLPFAVLLMMAANLLIDAVVGVVPLLGNVFDLVWKAHSKNLRLLGRPEELADVLREARWKLLALAGLVAALAAVLLFLLGAVLWLLLR